jgi:sulfide:quinone oxidoreductase
MIPMRGSAVSPEILQQFLDVIQNADGPILGYCRSGTRSAILWQIASQAQSQ